LNLPPWTSSEDGAAGRIIVVNTSLVTRLPRRTDVTVVPVAANEIAKEVGNAKAANMVALGAFLGASGLVEKKSVENVLAEAFPNRQKLIDLNKNALQRGFEIGQGHTAAVAAR
jgi:2-oxoglutarate ferredoxin oxidoreductase subunit gamma